MPPMRRRYVILSFARAARLARFDPGENFDRPPSDEPLSNFSSLRKFAAPTHAPESRAADSEQRLDFFGAEN
jgi:hypothetical protein